MGTTQVSSNFFPINWPIDYGIAKLDSWNLEIPQAAISWEKDGTGWLTHDILSTFENLAAYKLRASLETILAASAWFGAGAWMLVMFYAKHPFQRHPIWITLKLYHGSLQWLHLLSIWLNIPSETEVVWTTACLFRFFWSRSAQTIHFFGVDSDPFFGQDSKLWRSDSDNADKKLDAVAAVFKSTVDWW